MLSIDSDAPRTYCYCSDTLPDERYYPQIANADLLYHEATFLQAMADRAMETHHTTALQAGQIASDNKVKKLMIGHFSARYKVLDELLEEASSVFANTELAIEGKTFVI